MDQAVPRKSNLQSVVEANESPGRTLIFGCGYLGSRVAVRARAAGHRVTITSRSRSKTAEWRARGHQTEIVDWHDARTLRRLGSYDRVLIAVSEDRAKFRHDPDAQARGVRQLLSHLGPQTDIVYISTTGVYHQNDGQWVDESTPAHPTRHGGRVHLAAENVVRQCGDDSAWTILRLAGIYGPRRVPHVTSVRRAEAIDSDPNGWLNLIHVEDAAEVVLAAWQRLESATVAEQRSMPRTLVVSDGQPVRRRDFYGHVASLCRCPRPTFSSRANDAAADTRRGGNKRVWSRRMKSELAVRLQFPDYRRGLRDVLGLPGVPPIGDNS